jgi:tetratricopeptide (TPR) repeat protein
MTLKKITIAVAIPVLLLQWPVFKHKRADAELGEFYSNMATAKFADARANIDEAIRLWPSNARYYYWRAYCAAQILPSQCPRPMMDGNSREAPNQVAINEADRDYRYGLKFNDRDAVSHHNLAWLEHLLGNNSEATREWQEAIEIDPGNATFHLSYGMFLDEMGDMREARKQYETAIQLTPSILDSPFFTRYRIRFPVLADSVVMRCIVSLESRLREGGDPILEARLGKLYLYSEKLDRAGELLEKAATLLPNLPLVWFNLGEVYRLRGQFDQALSCYKKANVIDGSLAEPFLRMAELSAQAGDKDLATRNFRLALQRWQEVKPITAAHNNRLYVGPRQVIDDLLPTTLVWYTSPCAASAAWEGLSELFPQHRDYAAQKNTCEQLPSPHGVPPQ